MYTNVVSSYFETNLGEAFGMLDERENSSTERDRCRV